MFLTIDSKGTEAKFDGTDYIGHTLNYVDIDNNSTSFHAAWG